LIPTKADGEYDAPNSSRARADVPEDNARRRIRLEVLVRLGRAGADQRTEVAARQVGGLVDLEVARQREDPVARIGEPVAPDAFNGGDVEAGELVGGWKGLVPRFRAPTRLRERDELGQSRVAGRVVDVRLQ
jgi:hypothetical protein